MAILCKQYRSNNNGLSSEFLQTNDYVANAARSAIERNKPLRSRILKMKYSKIEELWRSGTPVVGKAPYYFLQFRSALCIASVDWYLIIRLYQTLRPMWRFYVDNTDWVMQDRIVQDRAPDRYCTYWIVEMNRYCQYINNPYFFGLLQKFRFKYRWCIAYTRARSPARDTNAIHRSYSW